MSDAPDDARDPVQLDPTAVYERVGGLEAFEALVDAFYARVEHDEVLRPQYPDDLEPGKRHLALFLAQYWGGGDLYSAQRGHPRLRMRHAPFTVDADARDAWLKHMRHAIETTELPDESMRQELWDYLERAAYFMVNA